jgi:hypothetical protein
MKFLIVSLAIGRPPWGKVFMMMRMMITRYD